MNPTAVARPLPGSGLVARNGDLLMVCADGADGVEELLDLVSEVAAAGGDGTVLIRRVAALLAADFDDRFPACAATGPAPDGRLAVLVYRDATAEIVGADGQVSLSGAEAFTSVNRLVAGPITAIKLQLPGAGPASSRARLDGGVVVAGGVDWSDHIGDAAGAAAGGVGSGSVGGGLGAALAASAGSMMDSAPAYDTPAPQPTPPAYDAYSAPAEQYTPPAQPESYAAPPPVEAYAPPPAEAYAPAPDAYAAPQAYAPPAEPPYLPPPPDAYAPPAPEPYAPAQPAGYLPLQPDAYPPAQPDAYAQPQPDAYAPPPAYPPAQPDAYAPPQPDAYAQPPAYPPAQPDAYAQPPAYPPAQPDAYAQPQPDPYAQPQPDAYQQQPAAYPPPDAYAQPQPDAYAPPQPQAYVAPQPDAYAQPPAEGYAPPPADAYAAPPAPPYYPPPEAPPLPPPVPDAAPAPAEGAPAGQVAMRTPDPAAPFVAVLLVGDHLEADEPPAPVVDMRPRVLGVLCKNDHFNDPNLHYCSVCGISMAQQTLVKHEGPRPPLGVLLMDDGMTFRLDTDYVIGREPQHDPEVVAGAVRPLRIADAEGVVSRRHARVALVGWDVQVVDLGSANGTYVQLPGDPQRHQLAPNQPVVVQPGTLVTLGRRWFRYESHRNP